MSKNIDGDTRKIYLDHNATTPVEPAVIDEMMHVYKTCYGNASSIHSLGVEARDVLENARKRIANKIGVSLKEIIFTGSGTESDNLAIQGTAFKNKSKGKHVITSNIEHSAVRNTCNYLKKFGFKVTEIPVNEDGIINLDLLQDSITPETILITVMYANNELGTIQPIKAIGDIAHDKNVIFHTDAVQAFGKIPIDFSGDGFHLLSASAHKIYGPKGVGLLYMRGGGELPGIGRYIQPIIQGGGHERGYRPATENVPGIAGFARAVEIAWDRMEDESRRERTIQDLIIDRILAEVEDSRLNGSREKLLPNTVNVNIAGVKGESLLLKLDKEGFEVSTGSACSSRSFKASHVLLAIGLSGEAAHGSLRISIGRSTTEDIANSFVDALKKVVIELRQMKPGAK
ncbi:MAG: cysteine desulfurase family protein [Promethearchaeota archaeon]